MKIALLVLLAACSATEEDYVRTDGPVGVTDGPSNAPADDPGDPGDTGDTGDTGDSE